MARIEGACREVCNATEFVAIVTWGEDGPHLAGHWGSYMFLDIEEARRIIESWGMFYNTIRPHSALGYLTPTDYAKSWTANHPALS